MSGVTSTLRGLLLTRVRVVMIAVGILVALLVGATHLIDEGEIVKVATTDSEGRDHVTELWIVDLEGGPYLRAGSPDVAWLARIRAQPEVTLQRGDLSVNFQAICEEDASIRGQVSLAMSEKYGFADRLWARVSDRRQAVAVRLVPSSAAMPPTP